ncbi:MAG: response regulator [Microbacteriaceae bacterium]
MMARTKSPLIRVLIVDDQPDQRGGFRNIIDSQDDMTVVGEAGDGATALAFARRNAVDVILMDVRMPRVNGLVATERISTDSQVAGIGPAPRIIVTTALELDELVPSVVAAGAFAMLYKDAEPEFLLETIRDAAATIGGE